MTNDDLAKSYLIKATKRLRILDVLLEMKLVLGAEPTPMIGFISDYLIQGPVGTILPKILEEVR